jgi:hypothetical protein
VKLPAPGTRVPVFPVMGWCCVACKREFAGGNLRCAYCRQLESKLPSILDLA